MENLAFNFNLLSNNSVDFTFDPVQNAIVLTCSDISGVINGRFK